MLLASISKIWLYLLNPIAWHITHGNTHFPGSLVGSDLLKHDHKEIQMKQMTWTGGVYIIIMKERGEYH